ncbi:peptide deformylase [Dactylosporangium sp. NPDC005555]|uniref:peptide deformylase n=1 Tax=Dactylosporangium sp. NPDC005555 TaxID=3154889 RepID=UPI0033A22A56
MTSDVASGRDTTDSLRPGRRRASEVMAALGIVQLGSPILTSGTRPFSFPGDRDEALRILDRLTSVADAVEREHEFTTGAMGLAAPQVGEPRSMAVFRAAGTPQLVLVNPQVVTVEPADRQDWEETSEGCLSFFDFRCVLRRPRTAVVRYRTITGEPAVATFDQGRLARDVLHEIDHLNGVLCLDHVEAGSPAIFVA